jgi:hypothetical protein
MSNINKKLLSNKVIKQNKDLKVSGDTVYCNSCEKIINYEKLHISSHLQQHVKTDKHQKNQQIKNLYTESSINFDSNEICNKFYLDIGRTFIEADIPLFKLRHPSFKKFLEYYMQRVIPNDSTIRRETIDPLFSEKVTKIQQKISNNSVYFILDETTDSSNRLVVNI